SYVDPKIRRGRVFRDSSLTGILAQIDEQLSTLKAKKPQQQPTTPLAANKPSKSAERLFIDVGRNDGHAGPLPKGVVRRIARLVQYYHNL
ncbi:MAG TPA: hypothetical protein VG713_03555, partial [Pirellulales bacterium]|nr:hypothetical protein [Pirellulales bacterium]